MFNLDNLIMKFNELFEEEIKETSLKENETLAKQMISLVEDTFKKSLSVGYTIAPGLWFGFLATRCVWS